MIKLAVYGFGYNLDKIKYPWRESLRSALDLVGEDGQVYFCACDEETYAGALELDMALFGKHNTQDRLHVMAHAWGEHHSVQATIANVLLDHIGTKQDYALKLDMDEVLCEWSFDSFRRDLELMAKADMLLAKPHYTHFSPDFNTTWPFIYDSKAVISRTSSWLRYNTNPKYGNADACALGGAPEWQTSLHVYHYGKVATGRERESLFKETTFQQLYSHPEDGLGFPDPRVTRQAEKGFLDYAEVFEVSKARGEFKPYAGDHPKFVRGWIEAMKARSATFWRDMEDGKALTL